MIPSIKPITPGIHTNSNPKPKKHINTYEATVMPASIKPSFW